MKKGVLFVVFVLSLFAASGDIGIQEVSDIYFISSSTVTEFDQANLKIFIEFADDTTTLDFISLDYGGVVIDKILTPSNRSFLNDSLVTWNKDAQSIQIDVTANEVSADRTYNWTVLTNDSLGNVFTKTLELTVLNDFDTPTFLDPVVRPENLTYDPNKTYEFNVTWKDNVGIDNVTFIFDGINYTNVTQDGDTYSITIPSQPAGNHTYEWVADDLAGNTNTTGNLSFSIDLALDTLSLLLNGSQSNLSIVYGTQSTVTALSTSGTHQLYRDSSAIISPDINTFGVASYTYFVNSSGNENYSAHPGITYTLTVNKASSQVQLLLNGTDGNITIELGSLVNITGHLLIGSGDIALTLGEDELSTQLYYGSSPGQNLSTFTSLGSHLITAGYEGNQNYSGSQVSHFVTVQDTTSPECTDHSASPTSPFTFQTPQNYTFSVNCIDSDTVSNVTIQFNNVNYSTVLSNTTYSFTIANLSEGSYEYKWFATDSNGNILETELQTFVVEAVPSTPSNPGGGGGGGGGGSRSKTECNDGIDNDGNGLVDLDDPECVNRNDKTEGDPNAAASSESETTSSNDGFDSLSICVEDWECTEWSECVDGNQIRTCTDRWECGTEHDKPIESQSCIVPEPEPDAPAGVGQATGIFSNVKNNWKGVLAGAVSLVALALAGWKRKALVNLFRRRKK